MNRIDELAGEIQALEARLKSARAELLLERFRDVPRLATGDLVLVRRKIFGKARWWPAQVIGVYLDYASGHDRDGKPWERKTVSYAVLHQRPDSEEYADGSHGYYSAEVQLRPVLSGKVKHGHD